MDLTLGLVTTEKSEEMELVKLAQNGSREAFDLLFQRHRQFIYSVCRNILGSAEDATDAAQSAFIQAYRALRSFRGQASFRSWLCRIAINTANDILRKEQRRRSLSAGMEIAEEPDRPNDRVWETIQALPSVHKAPLVLFYFHDLSHEEMAEALGCSAGSARVRLHRARAAFKQKYEEDL